MKKILFIIVISLLLVNCSKIEIKEGENISKNNVRSSLTTSNENIDLKGVYYSLDYFGDHIYHNTKSRLSKLNYTYTTFSDPVEVEFFGESKKRKYMISDETLKDVIEGDLVYTNYNIDTVNKNGGKSSFRILVKKYENSYSRNKDSINYSIGLRRDSDEYKIFYGIKPKSKDKNKTYFLVNISKLNRYLEKVKENKRIIEKIEKEILKYTKMGYSRTEANYYRNGNGKSIEGQKRYKNLNPDVFRAGIKSGTTVDKYVDRIFKYTKLKTLYDGDIGDIRNKNPYTIKGQATTIKLGKPIQIINKKSALYKIRDEIVRVDFANTDIVYPNNNYRHGRVEVTVIALDPYVYRTVMGNKNTIMRFMVIL
ncbi:MAG: hypothetical protein WBG30_11175 [Psychrilyobacter sp.]|uniref:hypothetical protein n=1 Tax=Psychrilyobacter sp. TaxID=2586924 RepID=UPI003C72D87C